MRIALLICVAVVATGCAERQREHREASCGSLSNNRPLTQAEAIAVVSKKCESNVTTGKETPWWYYLAAQDGTNWTVTAVGGRRGTPNKSDWDTWVTVFHLDGAGNILFHESGLP